MTKEEAKKIISEMHEYVEDGDEPGTLVLDGTFTKAQLQAILLLDFQEEA